MTRTISTLIISILWLSIPNLALAAPVVTLDTFPSSVVAGLEFDLTFSASGLEPATNYNSKTLGGESFNQVDTWNGGWLQQNASWSSMPEFLSNAEGSASASIKARFESDTSSGTKEFKIRIRKLNSDPYYDSSIVNISVIAATTTPTATPTVAATGTPTPVPTPAKTATPTPTKTPTPNPTRTSSPTPSPEVLGEEATPSASPKPTATAGEPVTIDSSKKKIPFVPIILIFFGLLILGLAVLQLMRVSKNPPTS